MGDMEEIREQAFKGGIYAVGGHLLICSLNDFYCYSSFVPKLSPLAFNGQVSRFKSDDDIAVVDYYGAPYYLPRYYKFNWSDTEGTHNETIYQYYMIEHATLHVPAELLESYKQTFPWNMFSNIVALTEEEMADGISPLRLPLNGERCNAIYNLQGQRINGMQKGLNIVDGKKMWVR